MRPRKPTAPAATRKPASPSLRFLYDRYIGDDPDQRAVYESHVDDAEIARRILDLRTRAGLSQRALAKRVGTTASVICRLEDAEYDGHSLSMLRRIASVLNQRIEVRFVPLRRKLAVR